MKNDVMIRLVSHQITEEDEPETLEVTTKGTLEKTDDGYLLTYNEVDEELKDCRTLLTVHSGNHVTMMRTGSFNSELIIEKNKRHSCHYETPFGGLMMGVFASDVNAAIKETGGRIRLKYTIDFNSSMVSENTVTITVKQI